MNTEMIPAQFPWLSLMVALPLLSAVLLTIPALRQHSRVFALVLSLAELLLAVQAAVLFDWAQPGSFQLVESYEWMPMLGVTWSLGVNALSLIMVLLATALVPIVVLAGWGEDSEPRSDAGYLALVLCLETFMVAIFVVDGAANGIAALSKGAGKLVALTQTGNARTYASYILGGVVIALAVAFGTSL